MRKIEYFEHSKHNNPHESGTTVSQANTGNDHDLRMTGKNNAGKEINGTFARPDLRNLVEHNTFGKILLQNEDQKTPPPGTKFSNNPLDRR